MSSFFLPTPRRIAAAAALLLAFARAPEAARGQSTFSFQGFETADSWTITTGAGNISTATGSGDTPASQRIVAGSRSWQVAGVTGTLQLASTSITGYTGVSLTYRATGTSTNTSNGIDAADYLRSFVALNGAAFPTNSAANAAISLVGATNSRWGFNATLTATTTAGTNLQVASPQNGTSTNNYSTFVINIPNGNSSVAARFVNRTSATTELWNLDNVVLSGTVPSTATWDANGTTAGTGGTGTWDLTNRRFTNGDLIWNNTVNGPVTAVTFGSTAGTVTAGTGISVNAMSFTVSGYTVQGSALTLAGTSPNVAVPSAAHVATISSAIGGANSLNKSGSGRLVTTGASTYSGVTSVTAGTLVVNGTHSGGNSYTVAPGSSLAGSGTITPALNRVVTVNGSISPGDASTGRFTLSTSGSGYTDLAPGGSYDWQLSDATGAAGVGWDQLALGALTISATSGSKFTIRVVGTSPANFNSSPPGPGYYSWRIATATSISGFDVSKFTIDASAFTPLASGGHFIIAQSGNDLELYYVPEPAFGGLAITAILTFSGRGRRRVTPR